MRIALLLSALLCSYHPVPALANIPANALRYRAELTRNARAIWGLGAPVATFAGQIHQESVWNASARSPVGAQGLAQFMPATARWIADIYPTELGDNQPYNPAWAMRALVRYNRWNWQRLSSAATECDRMAFSLAAYNGGLGWVQRDQKLAAELELDNTRYWGAVESVNAGRTSANFQENRNYVQRVIYRWQPLYVAAGWGTGVCN